MRKSIQFGVLLFSVLILVSYQNCGQAVSEFGEWNSYDSDSSSTSFGTFFLVVNSSVAVTPSSSIVQITGECNPGRSEETRIEWTLYPGSSYSGTRSGIGSGCIGQYFDFSIPLADDFDYSSGNSIMLRYVVANEEGEEEKRDYYVNLVEGVIEESTKEVECGSPGSVSSSSLKQCPLSEALARTSLGFAGVSIRAKVSPSSTTSISSNSSRYPLIHITDVDYEPYITYSTGKADGSESDYTFEWFHLHDEKFQYNVYQGTTIGKLAKKSSSDDKEESDYIWLSGETYIMELNYSKYYRVTGAGFVHIKVCKSSDSNVCPVDQSFQVNVPYLFGLNGLRIVYGTPDEVTPMIDGDWTNISGWSFSDVDVKVCGSEYLAPTYQSEGRCFQ